MSDQSLEIQRLREELARLSGEVETLRAERAEMKSANEKLLAEKEEMQQVINDLRSMMAWFRKKLFYKMSEKNLPLDPNVLEPTLFDQSLSEEEQARLDAEVKAMEEQNAKAIEVKAHKRDVRRPVLSGDLPVEETHIYPEGVQDNPEYVEIGVENTDTVAIQPARMYVKRIVRHKFVLRSELQIEDPDRQAFLIAPLPETIRPKGMADASLLADILINKYVYHLPFYRQIQKYKELGVLLNDATIGDWFAAVCEKLRPLYDKLREQIMSSEYIQVDESTLPVIDNEKHRAVKGYMWAVRDALTGSVYFHYDMGSRSGDTARKLIGGYRGAVQTDGYEVYESFENAPGKRMIGCWAHVRRKFVEALDENRKYASEAIVYIGKLYKIEAEMREAGLSAEEVVSPHPGVREVDGCRRGQVQAEVQDGQGPGLHVHAASSPEPLCSRREVQHRQQRHRERHQAFGPWPQELSLRRQPRRSRPRRHRLLAVLLVQSGRHRSQGMA